MNEEKRYLNNEENVSPETAEVFRTPDFTANTEASEFSGPSHYAPEQTIEVNGDIAPEEAFEFSPEMATEWELLSQEEKGESIELIQEAILLANVSETGNEAAEKAAKISTLGTAFAVIETPTSENEEEGGSSLDIETHERSFWERSLDTLYGAASKGARAAALAATLGVAAIAPMKTAQAGFFDQLAGSNVQQSINKVDRAMRGKMDIEKVRQQQENKQMRIEQLEREKQELIRRASSNTHVDQVRNIGEKTIHSADIEKNYEVGKAQIEADLAKIDAQEAKIDAQYETSRMDKSYDTGIEANYVAQKAKLKADRAGIRVKAIKLDAQYETNKVKEDARVGNTDARIDSEAGKLGDRISRIEMEQQRLRMEIERLNMQKVDQGFKTVRDILR